MKVKVKRGDTGFKFRDILTVDDVVLVTVGKTVSFLLRKDGTDAAAAMKVSANPLTPVAATDPNIEYQPDQTYLDYITANGLGTYRQEWEVDMGGGLLLTFPQASYNKVEVIEDLG